MLKSAVTAVEYRPDLIVAQVRPENPDAAQLQQLESEVAQAAAARPELPLVLDLSNVNFIPSLSLGVLIGMATDACGRGQKFILAGLQSRVRRVFNVAQLEKVFTIHDTVDAAAASLRAGG